MPSERQRRFLILLGAVLLSTLTARLGVWQLDRAAQKRAQQALVAARQAEPPLPAEQLRADALGAAGQLQRRVALRGRWLADKTIFLDNRPMGGRAGFYVVTPLLLEGRAEAVLVQRGWVPRDAQQRSRLPDVATPVGQPVWVSGRLIAAPSRLFELGAAVGGTIRQNLDSAAYAQEIHQALLPLTVLQQDPNADGLLRDWPAPDDGLQKHYGYAFQWFALSALTLVLYVWFQLIRPRRRRPE